MIDVVVDKRLLSGTDRFLDGVQLLRDVKARALCPSIMSIIVRRCPSARFRRLVIS
jgi:hypothetical protein